MEEKDKTRPVHETRVGMCRCAIWKHLKKDGSERFSVTVSRIYPTPNGTKRWAYTDSFSALDIPILQRALDQAFDYMTAIPARVSTQPEVTAEEEVDRVASI